MSVNSRQKGHSFERAIAKLFREAGFNCTTSRFSSKEKDDMKIDLCGTDPFYFQLKAVERLGSYHDILASMPEEEGKYNALIHKRNNRGSVVTMTLPDFMELIEMMKENGVI